MSDVYNISAIQGSTLLLHINCKDSNNNYINFSGYTARGYVKYKYSSTGYLLNLNPIIDQSYVSGLIRISGNADDLANISCGRYPFDIEASGANNYIFKPIRGYFDLEPEVSSF